MPNEDESLWLVGNGEIYNSQELRRELEEKGHCFRSQSDNEVLLHLYEEEGDRFLQKVKAMVALALWDGRRGRLILGRDRLGIKPLYYYHSGPSLVFASEIKALLVNPLVRSGIDPEGLRQYLSRANTFGPTTLHRNINMVEPGQCVIWERGEVRKRGYWRPHFSDEKPPTLAEAGEQYLFVAEKAVGRHLMSDVEVASYLSSGLDSTTVSALAAPRVDGALATYTGAFNIKGWYDERPGSAAVAARINARHQEVVMTADDFREVLDDLVFALDEPRMGFGAFSQYIVAREAARRVKVILTGHGGDELFAGYPVFKLIILRPRPHPGGRGRHAVNLELSIDVSGHYARRPLRVHQGGAGPADHLALERHIWAGRILGIHGVSGDHAHLGAIRAHQKDISLVVTAHDEIVRTDKGDPLAIQGPGDVVEVFGSAKWVSNSPSVDPARSYNTRFMA